MERTDEETGRRGAVRKRTRAAEEPRRQGWKEGAVGKERVPKGSGAAEMKGNAWDGLKAAGHSPDPRGRQGRGRRTAADADRTSGLNVRTGEAPAAAANRPDEGRGRVRGSEVGTRGGCG